MSSERPTLFDRAALLRNRARAQRSPVDFLRLEAIADLEERLIEVNRTFTDVVIVTPRPDLWKGRLEGARFISDDDHLNLAEDSCDLIIHDLCLHWANDPVGQLIQSRRALRPDGLFLGTMFGGLTLQELRTALAEAEARLTGGLSPRVAPMAEVRDLGGLLQRAGFALPVADARPLNVSYASMTALMSELRQMGETTALSGRRRQFSSKALFEVASDIYAQNFPADDNRILATFDIITLTGWAPSADQPKALRPGSATNSLAEALGTKETKLKPF